MEQKTKIHYEEGCHDLFITREFELPVDLLFKAHTDAEIFGEWMSHEFGSTKVLKLEAKKHGAWQFQTVDVNGNILFAANGVFAEFVLNEKITRTFEMENTPFSVQLEFLEFSSISEEKSMLSMQSIYRSVALRDEMLKRPFAYGLSMAHDRLQYVLNKLK
jgi:uncharacterized protein YndB with AHSA1/START domain